MMRKDIKLVFCPYGTNYSIPYSIAGLKPVLESAGIKTKCVDLSIAFYHHFNLFKLHISPRTMGRELSYKDQLVDLNNWVIEENFYKNVYPTEEFQKMIEKFCNDLISDFPSYIGFSIFNSNLFFTIELCKLIKKKTNIKIILGGPDCTSQFNRDGDNPYPKFLKEKLIDYVVINEGEKTLVELVHALKKNESLKDIKGLLMRDRNENVVFTGKQEQLADLDALPIPDYSDFNINEYPVKDIPIVFNRGCNYKCVFCDIQLIWGDAKSFRHRSAKSIAEEIISFAKEDNGIEYVTLNGAYINTSKNLLQELADTLNDFYSKNPTVKKIKFKGYARVNTNLTASLCKDLYNAGLYKITFGLESGSEKVAREMKKAFPMKVAAPVFKNVKDSGIMNTIFIIIGFPTETEEDFEQTLSFLENNAHTIDAAYCMSEFYLSDQMQLAPEIWGVEDSSHYHEFKSKLGAGSIEDRTTRLSRFYKKCEELKIAN